MKKFTIFWFMSMLFTISLNAQQFTIEEILRLNTEPQASSEGVRSISVPQNQASGLRSSRSLLAGECDNAIVITSGAIVNQPLICGSVNLLNSTSVPVFCDDSAVGGPIPTFYGDGLEATYKYTPATAGPVTITVSNTTWAAIFVYDGCPTEGGSCVVAIRSTTPTRTVNFNAVANTEYLIWIDTWPAPASPCVEGGLLTLSGPEPAGGGGGGGGDPCAEVSPSAGFVNGFTSSTDQAQRIATDF
ncbi:MAG: hypothetical protein CVU03_10070, partial [Bacteroidetes bacterium HGW-Bacteroidetes-2]